jgi:hypothetical protein
MNATVAESPVREKMPPGDYGRGYLVMVFDTSWFTRKARIARTLHAMVGQ